MTRSRCLMRILVLLGSASMIFPVFGQEPPTPAELHCESPRKAYEPLLDRLMPRDLPSDTSSAALNYQIVLRSIGGLPKEWQIVFVARGKTLEAKVYTVGKNGKSIWEELSSSYHEGVCPSDEEIQSRTKIASRELKLAPQGLGNLVSELFRRQVNLQLETNMDPDVEPSEQTHWVLDLPVYDLWIQGRNNSVHFRLYKGNAADTSKWLMDWIDGVKKMVDQAK